MAVLSLVLLCGGWSLAGEMVGVGGSKARFATQIEVPNGGKPVKLNLTGTAMRTRTIVNVYAVASYLQDGVKADSPETLAAADAYKVLHLHIERNLTGKEMSEAFTTAIRKNYPQGFNNELKQFQLIMGAKDLKEGQEVVLTWLPKSGLRCQIKGQTDMQITSPAFARAIWDVYFGKNHLGDSVKNGLTSRL